MTTKTASLTAKANTNGKLAKFTPENLSKAKSKEKANGSNPKLNQTAIHTKVNISMIRNTDTVFSHGLVEIFTRAALLKTKGTSRDRCCGLTAVRMRANGKEEYSTASEESYSLMVL